MNVFLQADFWWLLGGVVVSATAAIGAAMWIDWRRSQRNRQMLQIWDGWR